MSHTPTTAAIVECSQPRFGEVSGAEDPELVTITLTVSFNGTAPGLGEAISFPRNASMSTKQAAVRDKVNQLLQVYEPTVTLTNANIQIMGLPV